LGLQIAEALGEARAPVLIVSRKELEEVAARLKARDVEALWIAADTRVETGIVRLVDNAIARLGQIDILVNNAGACGVPPPRIIRSRHGTRS
jgi:NAD(P)-dependent dehydrogenase (short-subunit alcohol dehydrogenase family)